MELKYGTEEDHRATLARAKENEIDFVWSGDLRNEYLRENIAFGEEEGVIKTKFVDNEEAQMSGLEITWLK